jgi:hypothetical protein
MIKQSNKMPEKGGHSFRETLVHNAVAAHLGDYYDNGTSKEKSRDFSQHGY